MRDISYPPPSTAEVLSFEQWNALPSSVRVADHIVEVVILLEALRDDLRSEEGKPFRWIEPVVDEVRTNAERILRKLSV